MNEIRKTNQYAQNVGAEIAQIKKVIKKIKYEIKIKLVKGHPKRVETRREDTTAHLMKQCDEVARKTREKIEEQSNMTNIKYYGCYSMKI